MSRLKTILHGEASEAAELINREMSPARDEMLLELRAGLVNALRRIDVLETSAAELLRISKG